MHTRVKTYGVRKATKKALQTCMMRIANDAQSLIGNAYMSVLFTELELYVGCTPSDGKLKVSFVKLNLTYEDGSQRRVKLDVPFKGTLNHLMANPALLTQAVAAQIHTVLQQRFDASVDTCTLLDGAIVSYQRSQRKEVTSPAEVTPVPQGELRSPQRRPTVPVPG